MRVGKAVMVVNFIVAAIFLAGGQALAWTRTVNFDAGTVGAIANGTPGFDYAGTKTTYSSDTSISGGKSAKMAWAQGDGGWGLEHGEINFPSQVNNGGELWIRGYYYFAPGWSFLSNIGEYSGVKIMRLATDIGGWISIASVFSPNVTASNEQVQLQQDTGSPFVIGAWQSLEMYVKLSPTQGIFRIWQNGKLVFEDKNSKTISSSSGYINMASVMSVWNNGCGSTQNEYVDDFIITTDTPSQRDANGNPMIGPISSATALLAPGSLRATFF